MGSQRSGPDGPAGNRAKKDLTEDEFFSLLEEMTDQLSRGGDGSYEDEDDEETITDEMAPGRADRGSRRQDGSGTGGATSMESELAIETAEDTDELRRTMIPGTATLRCQFTVQAATGSGGFAATEATGELGGGRSYDIVLLDELAFGFDAHRNSHEIVLDPGAATVETKEVEGSRVIALMLDTDGQVKLFKAPGVRVDVYSIRREGDGGARQPLKIGEMATDADGRFTLPTDLDTIFEQFSEFMLGIGLTEEESLCYAFSVYLAIRLEQP